MKAKIKEKLFNRRDEVEVEEVSGELPESFKNIIKALIETFGGGSLKVGFYIVNDDYTKVEWIDELPENYTGSALWIGDDYSIGFEYYAHGELQNSSTMYSNDLNIDGITFSQKATVWEVDDDFDSLADWLSENVSKVKAGDFIHSTIEEEVLKVTKVSEEYFIMAGTYSETAVMTVIYSYSQQDEEWQLFSKVENPIGFEQTYLTHSFNELDATLKQIVEDAIADAGQTGVACTEAQWIDIKSLLDKLLYLNYDGYSMIKTVSNGIDTYVFGVLGNVYGARLELFYDVSNSKLFGAFGEL